MNIGILSSIAQPIRKEATGGTEVFCATLTEGLIKKGHKVFLFATPGSEIEGAELIRISDEDAPFYKEKYKQIYSKDIPPSDKNDLYQALNIRTILMAKMFEEKIDLFHDNTSSILTGVSSNLFKKPIVTTVHMPPLEGYDSFIKMPRIITNPTNYYVTVARWQLDKLREDGIINSSFVYNGIQLSDYSFNESGEDNILWIGRISSKTPKGLKEALLTNKNVQKKLLISGIISDEQYFKNEIEPLISQSQTELIKVASNEQKNKFFSRGKVSLFPIEWEEPFGLVFIESMACGTPVIAFARGAVPEIIKDGITGFIVNSSEEDKRGDFIIKKTGIEGLCEAINKIYSMPQEEYRKMREECHKHVETNFSVEKMVDGYEEVYKKILSNAR